MKKQNVIAIDTSVKNNCNYKNVISPQNRTFDVLEELILSEEIDDFYHMTDEKVVQELDHFEFSKPPEPF